MSTLSININNYINEKNIKYLENIVNIISNIPFEEMINSDYMNDLDKIRIILDAKSDYSEIEVDFLGIVPPPHPILIRN